MCAPLREERAREEEKILRCPGGGIEIFLLGGDGINKKGVLLWGTLESYPFERVLPLGVDDIFPCTESVLLYVGPWEM